MPAFELSKWYADCTSEEGDAVIIYHAELRWRAVTLYYASLLTHRAGCPPRALYSLRKHPAPAVHGDQLVWESPDWRASGRSSVCRKPALILFFGALVGFVALAMLQAIYGINLK